MEEQCINLCRGYETLKQFYTRCAQLYREFECKKYQKVWEMTETIRPDRQRSKNWIDESLAKISF